MTKPKHIAIIMDGNGRWAQAHGLKRSAGHLEGAKAVREVLSACIKQEIPHLSLYAFSTENWNRPQEEVNYLFKLFSDFVTSELSEMIEQGIRLTMIGDSSRLPLITRKTLQYALDKTKKGTKLELILALNYSGTSEILHATRQSAVEILSDDTNLEQFIKIATQSPDKAKDTLKKEFTNLFSESNFTDTHLRNHFYHNSAPDPDLIIRTSGELRLSNFYLYQAAYAEFYFTDTLWPDFKEEDLCKALEAFALRKRRFGKVEE